MEWFIKVLRQYADFNGRARRQEYWMFTLFWFLAGLAIAVVFIGIAMATASHVLAVIGMVILGIYYLGTIVPYIAVTSRRLHDIGQSGWVQVVAWIPIVSIVGGIVVFVMSVLEGNRGPNKYGPDPKALPEVGTGYGSAFGVSW